MVLLWHDPVGAILLWLLLRLLLLWRRISTNWRTVRRCRRFGQLAAVGDGVATLAGDALLVIGDLLLLALALLQGIELLAVDLETLGTIIVGIQGK